MDSPRDDDSKQNNTFPTSDNNLGLLKVEMERQISVIRNFIANGSRLQHFMRDEYDDKMESLQSLLTNLQKVVAMEIDISKAQKKKTEADLDRMKMDITELRRNITQSEGQRTERAWVANPGAGSSHQQALPPIRRSNSLDSIHSPCQQFNNFEKRKNEVLGKYGVVKKPQKEMMLKKWRSQRGSNGNLVQDLQLKTSRFLIENSSDLLKEDELFKQVIDQIPDDDWLKFVRIELRLSETEIREVKQTCQPTDEQLYQLSLEGATET